MSKIEPLAREICEKIFRRSGMTEADNHAWVDRHWEAATADIKPGQVDDDGDKNLRSDWRKGLEAYRERMLAKRPD